jgi:hypothetical protein
MEQDANQHIERILIDGARYLIAWFEIFLLLVLLCGVGFVFYRIVCVFLQKESNDDYENPNGRAEKEFEQESRRARGSSIERD